MNIKQIIKEEVKRIMKEDNDWWGSLSPKAKQKYLQSHPGSELANTIATKLNLTNNQLQQKSDNPNQKQRIDHSGIVDDIRDVKKHAKENGFKYKGAWQQRYGGPKLHNWYHPEKHITIQHNDKSKKTFVSAYHPSVHVY